MQLNVPPTLKRLSRSAFPVVVMQTPKMCWTEEVRQALSAHIEEGYLHAERGELIDGVQAGREIQEMKDGWRLHNR
jgi:hypothetical protein